MRWTLVALSLVVLGCTDPDPDPVDAGPTPDAGMATPEDAGPPPPSTPASEPLIEHVDPFLGTGGSGYNDLGNCYPGPATPYGMVHPGPDTQAEGGAAAFTHTAGYAASDDFINGFSHTRMHGTGTATYGNLGVMPIPQMEPTFTRQEGYMSQFSDEVASPGYYAVTLERGGIRAELTTTDRVAVHRYTFGGGSQAVLFDIGHRVSSDNTVSDGAINIDAASGEISGFATTTGGYAGRFGGNPIYFVARFDRPFVSYGVYADDALTESGTAATGGASGAWFDFDPADADAVVLEVAISYVDVEGARANLAAESLAFDFDAVRANTEAVWEQWLSRVRIEARQEQDFRRFYTALYHALLMPTLATDVDGRYRGLDQEVHEAVGYNYYTDFSLWDTYRTLHPMLTLLYPEVQLDFLRSLAAMARDGGAMPRWPQGIGYTGGMIGDPVALVMADSWVKGLWDFDLPGSYDALRRSAFGVASDAFGGRGNAEIYDRLGYMPVEAGGWSTSETLEFAYADWALATLADALDETADATRFRERAGNWRNTWDPEREFFVGRHEDGRFVESFDDDRWQEYLSEGTVWQYLWLVPHDLDGLAEHMGGSDVMLGRLRTFFEASVRERRTALPPVWYWHGNEPDLHAAYVFTALGAPDEGGRWSRWVARSWYGDGPTGLPGNDDAGTLSAWLVLATIGIFPITGEDHYLVGSPLSTRTEITLPDGTFVIEAPDASDAAPAPTEARLGDVVLSDFRLPHASIVDGATLHLSMAP